MERLNQREWVIGLHDYHGIPKPQMVFAAFHELVIEELRQLGLDVTYVEIEGDGYVDKATKARGTAYRRVKDDGFAGITGLSLICNPPNSDAPAYDRFFSASLGITPHNDNLLAFCLNDGILAIGSDGFRRILKRLANLYDWTTGYALIDLASKHPEFHVMGLDDGQLSADEYDRLTRWYTAKREDKVTRIRSIYPFNLLNHDQLQQRLSNGQTVRQFVESHDSSILIAEGYGNLALWVVSRSEVAAVRAIFDQSEAVIA